MLMQNLGGQTKSIMVFSEMAYIINNDYFNGVRVLDEISSVITKVTWWDIEKLKRGQRRRLQEEAEIIPRYCSEII